MNTTAHADQIHAQLRDARCCDALDPCDSCRDRRTEFRAARRGILPTPTVPAPRTALAVRLAAAKVSA